MELVHWSNSTMWTSHKTCCLFCTCPRWTSEVYFAEEGKSGRFCLLSFHHLGSVKFAAASFEIPSFSAAKLPWSLINWTMFHSTRTLPKDGKNPMKVKVIEPFKTFCCALQIIWTFSSLCWQSTVSRSSRQFLDCPDSLWILRTVFWIIRTVSRLSGFFLDCQDSLLTIRIVFGLSGQFLECPDNFWIVRKVLGLSG